MFMLQQQNAEQYHNIKIGKKSAESVKKFK